MSLLYTVLAMGQILSASPRDSVPVDTSMQPGRNDWAPYDTPMACLHAAKAIDSLTYRAVTELPPYTPERDTITSAAATAAKACGAKFRPTTVATSDLLDLVHLALMHGDDTTAHAAADRYVAAFSDPAQQRRSLLQLDSTYLRAKPMRVAAAEGILARLDALGTRADTERVIAHRWHFEDAEKRFDVEHMDREARAMITSGASQHAIDGNAIFALFYDALYKTQDVTAAAASAAQFLRSIGADTAAQGMEGIGAVWAGIIGQSIPALHADHWAGGVDTSHVWPTPGKVSILLWGEGLIRAPDRAAALRRVLVQYGSKIDVVLLCKTAGYFNESPPLTPLEETKRLGQFFIDELHLPVRVAVQESAFDVLPDGRRYQGAAPFESDPLYHIDGLLVNPSGKIALTGLTVAPNQSAMLGAWIDRVASDATSNTK